MPHPELELERARLAFARRCLEAMRAKTEAFVCQEDILAANEADTEAVRFQLQRRLRTLDDTGVLSFGRIDPEAPGGASAASGGGETVGRDAHTQYYIGRRHIDDDKGDPVVIDWRAPVAIPFYRATAADPLGLDGRRRFTFSGTDLADIYEEDFTDPESMLGDGAAHGVPDPLLAELRRERSGQMRDIVATIQAEQDLVIRAGLDECLVVQGGPGTGKTAVGLHRAAYLLYEQRETLARTGVLVLGPNRVFLDYIAQVLPSLGETAVTQSTLDGLFGLRFRLTVHDSVERQRLLGDARFARVIARACDEAIVLPTHEVVLRYRTRRLRIPPARIRELLDEARDRDAPLRMQRQRFRARLLREGYDQWSRGEPLAVAEDDFASEVLAHRESRTAIDALWRTLNPVGVIRSLMTSRAALARAADEIFDADEQRVILRTRVKEGSVECWSAAELPLVDEADALISDELRRYGHVVLDEAQDLSPMALRLVGRRALRSSMTILGDLAQATGANGSSDWRVALGHLGHPQNARRAELTIGYRLPAAILEFANRLLADAAPHVTPATSAREEGDPPELLAVTRDDLVARAANCAIDLSHQHLTTALIVPESLHADIAAALHAADPALHLDAASISERVSLLDPATAKGLEFDAVVVAEPTAIFDDGPNGPRLLYVALTRAVQHLTVVHSRALPGCLA